MKNYLKNKNFIPRSYLDNIENNKAKGNKRGLIYLIIINLLILPITIEGMFQKEEVEEEFSVVLEDSIYIKSITNWINEIDEDVIDLTVTNDSGVMTVNSLEKIYLLEEKGTVGIENIRKNEKGYYILDIKRNEQ